MKDNQRKAMWANMRKENLSRIKSARLLTRNLPVAKRGIIYQRLLEKDLNDIEGNLMIMENHLILEESRKRRKR